VTWRADGIQIFFRGDPPARLELRLSAGAFVDAITVYEPVPREGR
jgi:hypothetical protein